MDDAQVFTASAGASYIWNKTRFSVDAIYGSGLPTGFANTQFEQPYVQVNLGVSRQFATWSAEKPLTATFSVVNLLDEIYLAAQQHRRRRLRSAIRPAARLLPHAVAKALSANQHGGDAAALSAFSSPEKRGDPERTSCSS